MNNTADELGLVRSRLLDAIDRDLGPQPLRSRTIRYRPRLAISTLAALAIATVAVALGLTLSAASPQSAYAAAKEALAATDASSSGTMTSTFGLGDHMTNRTTQWHGNDLSISGDHGSLWGATQVLLIGGNVYAQQPDGTWQHYASESDAGRLATALQMARVDVAGSNAAQILAVVTGLQKTVQPDGSTVYTGTIPASKQAEVTPTDDTATRLGARLASTGRVSRFKLVVGSDGLVKHMDETAEDGSSSWNVEYSQLGSTPPITAPANATDVPSGTAAQDTQTPRQTTVGSQ